MDEVMRISVRELVAFSFFLPDILPAADAAVMLAGTRAHQLRQAQSEGQIEKSIRHVYEVDGLSLMVFGRMDAYTDGDVPRGGYNRVCPRLFPAAYMAVLLCA